MQRRFDRTRCFSSFCTLMLFVPLGCGDADGERYGRKTETTSIDANDHNDQLDVSQAREIRNENFTGKVITVKDGDTIVVLRDKEQITIRLEGIDCPESRQAFGNKAKHVCSDLCLGKTVTVKSTGEDRYRRTLAHIILPDGKELNRELVRQGFAWWYRKYSKDESLGQLEADAREKKLGLWADTNPVAPWDWRAAKRSKSKVSPSDTQVVPNGIEIVALLPNPKGTDAGNEQVSISNSTRKAVDLQGWKLVDKAGNVFLLSGIAKPGEPLVVTMTEATMPLNNNGDEVLLMDGSGVGRSRVRYSGSQAKSGIVLRFER